MDVWTKVMELLKDGEWHKVKEIQEKLGLNKFKTELLVDFLVSYGFCNRLPAVMGAVTQIRARSKVLAFLEELDKIEEAE